ncbi:PAS domain-containing sensor histidine kinase [Bacteroidota bacterium]
MVYKNYYINIIVRFILLFLFCLWFSYELNIIINNGLSGKVYTLIVSGSLLIFQALWFLHYLNKTNREINRFFSSLKGKDYSLKIPSKSGKGSLNELSVVLNETMEVIRNINVENKKQFQFLQIIVEHVSIGLISFSNNDEVVFINKAAKDLIKLRSVRNINDLKKAGDVLHKEIKKLSPGTQKLLKIRINDEFLQLIIKSSELKLNDEILKLVSLQNVKNELEENELQSWQRLIRVLTHEIMNSITPITTLTLAIKKCLSVENEEIQNNVDNYLIKDAIKNTDLIEERSKGLIKFVENYRSITLINKLKTENIRLDEFLKDICDFFNEELNSRNIKTIVRVNPVNLVLHADKKLLEQLIINLIKNSIEALEGKKESIIQLSSFKTIDEKIQIQVSDNGKGIMEELIDDIFIPFFTTKKAGSGIGLSLSRQIMRLHGGRIIVHSEPDVETIFTLKF